MQIATQQCRVTDIFDIRQGEQPYAYSINYETLEFDDQQGWFTPFDPLNTEMVIKEYECDILVDDYIAILYTPIFLILIAMIIMIALKIFEFRNPWKTSHTS